MSQYLKQKSNAMYLPQIVWLEFDYKNKHYEGEAIPVAIASKGALNPVFEIYFDNEYSGTAVQQNNTWALNNFFEEGLAKIVGMKLISFLHRD